LGLGRGKKTENENLHNEKCRDCLSSSNTIRAVKSRRIQWVRACGTSAEDEKRIQRIAEKKNNKRDYMEVMGVDTTIILKGTLKIQT